MLYTFPDIGRFGLGHSLLTWARARVWAERNQATPMAPDWLKLRVGPYLRRERDKRNYFVLFSNGNAIGGVRKRTLLARLPRVDEAQLPYFNSSSPEEPTIIVFRSVPNNDIRLDFGALQNNASFLRSELLAMTRPRYCPDPHQEPHIAVHVRLGDFAPATDEQLRAGVQNIRLPLPWYEEAVNILRQGVFADLPVRLYSDGTDRELENLLRMPNVTRSPARASITDMLAIAHATVLVGSGSGFSLWGSYLGQVPRVSYPGQGLVNVLDDRSQEISWESGNEIPTTFRNSLVARIAHQHSNVTG